MQIVSRQSGLYQRNLGHITFDLTHAQSHACPAHVALDSFDFGQLLPG